MSVTHTYKVAQFTVEWSQLGEGLYCEWTPRMPRPGELTDADMEQYRAGRAEFHKKFEEATGIRVLVVEI